MIDIKRLFGKMAIAAGTIPLALPAALAVSFASNPLGDALESVGELLNFRSLASNQFAVEGITRFALFMVVFAICHYGFMKVFKGDSNPQGKKTAAIVSFAVAMISTVAVNPLIGDANAGLFQGVVASFLVIFVFIGGGIYAILGLRPAKDDDPMWWVWHVFGLLLILLLISVLEIWVRYSGLAIR